MAYTEERSATVSSAQLQTLLNDPEYRELTRQKSRISGILTMLTLLIYFGFIMLLAFAPDLLAPRLGSATRGIPFGIAIIVLSWIFTGIYVRWANGRYDAMVAAIRAKAGQ